MSHLTRGLFDPRKYSQVWPEPNDDPNIPYAWGLNGYECRSNSQSVGALADFTLLDLPFLKDVLAAKSAITSKIVNGEVISEPELELLKSLNSIDFTSMAILASDHPLNVDQTTPKMLFDNLSDNNKADIKKLANPSTESDLKSSDKKIKVGHLIAGACVGALLSAVIISHRKGR